MKHVSSTPRSPASRRGIAFAATVAAALLSGCASPPQLEAQWTDASVRGQPSPLRGATVLVACDAYDLAIRQVCQDQLAAQVAARGATPVFAGAETPIYTDRALDPQLLPAARAANASALLVVTLTPESSERSSGVSVSIGGFGFGRGSAVGAGVTAPIGGGRITTGFAANGRITDVASGRLLWTARAVAPPSAELNDQFQDLSKTVLDGASRSGLF